MPERTLSPDDASWPHQLADLPDPPRSLRLRGQLPDLTGAVAVVGTRYADDEGVAFARKLGRELAAAGRAVISGGALGIDGAAHRGALDAGGATVCVLANGFDPAYPPEHRALFAAIEGSGSGALLTEASDGSPPERWTFLRRNRLVAALADSVVVVQAPIPSGALSTAAHAYKLERPVFSVPYAPWDARGSGCLQLLRRGGRICTSVRDVLSVPAREAGKGPDRAADEAVDVGPQPAETALDVSQLDEQSRSVLRALGGRPMHADNLARALGVPIMRVQHALLELLMLGLAIEPSPGRYARNPESNAR